MTANTDSFVAVTSLDYIAEGYWQDFLAQRPVAGGIAYESKLQACELDESLSSLQRIDALLSQIKRDLVKGDIVNVDKVSASSNEESSLLADDSFRNLLVFLAFYAGRVLARQWQSTPHWYSQSELRRRYPELPLIAENFYQEMAVTYELTTHHSSSLFFALEPIGLRLFGNIDRQFVAVQGGTVASGLYQAVNERLPDTNKCTDNTSNAMAVDTAKFAEVDIPINQPVSSNSELTSTTVKKVASEPEIAANIFTNKNYSINAQPSLTKTNSDTLVNNPRSDNPAVSNPAVANVAVANPEVPNPEVPNPVAINNNSSNQPATSLNKPNQKSQPTPELFTRLLTELDDIEVPQNAGVDDYLQARKTLDQFERHIARQNKPRVEVSFSETHQFARQQALLLLKKSADAGNTAAMLRLAMYELLGEGSTAKSSMTSDVVNIDAGKGVELIKQAANAKDSRAQRLLSRLYYQGVGVPQEITTGKYWLEQAAENGHPEAIMLNKEWQQAQLLIETQKQEQHSFKRYQLLIGAIAIAAILLILFV